MTGKCSCTGSGPGDEHYVEPESPVFDESFALDAQLILGSLVTPATAARPATQSRAAPAEPAQQVGCSCFDTLQRYAPQGPVSPGAIAVHCKPLACGQHPPVRILW